MVEEGGRTVSLGDLLGPEFAAHPRELFGPDNYHPSAEGYATAAMADPADAVRRRWACGRRRTSGPTPPARESILPVARAAAEAVAEGGTEVAAVRGPWALLKHRRRRRLPPAEDVTAEEIDPAPGASETPEAPAARSDVTAPATREDVV